MNFWTVTNFLCVLILVATVQPLKVQSSGWDYECIFEGERHAHEISCVRYYECRSNGIGGYFIYLFKCPEGFLYNGPFNTCVRGSCEFIPTTSEPEIPETTSEPELPETTQEPEIPETTAEPEIPVTTQEPEIPETTVEPEEPITTSQPEETTEELPLPESTVEPVEPTTTAPEVPSTEEPVVTTTTAQTTVDPPVTRPPFVCRQSGYFVDTQNCQYFHHCVCDAGICQDHVLKCPGHYYFCENISACAEPGYCECAADEILRSFFRKY
jgi:hypothetical protein